MNHKLTRMDAEVSINADWNKEPWQKMDAIHLSNHMGIKPEHFPDTRAKIAWDDSAIYIIFRVEDRYVRSVHKNHQDPVYKDSCVEFFFIPEEDINNGYFNLEMNCGGTMLFHHQTRPRSGAVNISDEHIGRIKVAATLPPIVEPEIDQKITWIVEYRIPFSILKEYHNFVHPEAGTRWRANFYKCADDSSHPHWLTWAPVENPAPDFHLPQYFGWIEF
ncbi:MAG: carbohydrate-binding family 9-like protein [Cyclobacteriaceae bacterium]|nr:carbohydrate-binding family 9-like protein [Cyclobacteriaceae bacterium]